MSIKVRFSLLVTRSVVYCVLGSIYDTHSLIPLQFSNFSRWLLFASQYISRSTHVTFCCRILSNRETKEGKPPSPATQAGSSFSFAKRFMTVEAF